MTTPYFVPSDDLLHAILHSGAARGWMSVLSFREKNDSMLVGWASRAFFTELLAAGVKIYQFEGGLLHTKSVLVDGELSLVGTVNLDMRSLVAKFRDYPRQSTIKVLVQTLPPFRTIIFRVHVCSMPVYG